MRHHYPKRVYIWTQHDGNKLIVTSHNAQTHTHHAHTQKDGAHKTGLIGSIPSRFHSTFSSSFALLCSQRETGHLNRYKNVKVLREGGRALEAGIKQLTSASSMSTRLPGLRA
jgi:hypothetical protein